MLQLLVRQTRLGFKETDANTIVVAYNDFEALEEVMKIEGKTEFCSDC